MSQVATSVTHAVCQDPSLMDVSAREATARAIVDGNSYMTLGTADVIFDSTVPLNSGEAVDMAAWRSR